MQTFDIGITQDELREQVIARATDRIVEHYVSDEEVSGRFESMVREALDETASRIAAETVEPMVDGIIEGVVLQRTDEWGEKVGEGLTFRQYLVQRAEHYLREPVDRDGKTKADSRDWNYRATQERIAHMLDKHLHYSIKSAMEDALKAANGAIVEGLQATVKMKLAEISQTLKVDLKVGR